MRGFEYRSAEGWRGVPVIHIAFGSWEGGRDRPGRAIGLIAVGDTAMGMVAVGGPAGPRERRFSARRAFEAFVLAVGMVSAGVVAAGVVAVGVVGIGLRVAGIVVAALATRAAG